jgi:hypothetical protein
VPPGAAYAETLTPAVGMAISTIATMTFVMLLRAPNDCAPVLIDHSSTGRMQADTAT